MAMWNPGSLFPPRTTAQALYHKIDLSPRFSLHYYWRKPVSAILSSDLEIVPLHESSEQLRTLALLDKLLLGHWRDVDHRWLLSDRQGYLYFRDNDPVGYDYVGHRNGPFALMHSEDFPAVLAHAESQAVAAGTLD